MLEMRWLGGKWIRSVKRESAGQCSSYLYEQCYVRSIAMELCTVITLDLAWGGGCKEHCRGVSC